MMDYKLQQLSRVLGYHFNDISLLRSALTHRSMGRGHNERLEFLGDAILSFTVASELYQRFPKMREGDLTRMRAILVRGETLAQIARDLELGNYLNLGMGEQKSGGHTRASILSDALEAIIGAIYLDSEIQTCKACIIKWYHHRFDALLDNIPEKDAKTRLQEFCQARHLALPKYQVILTEGDPHAPLFKVQCTLPSLDSTPIIGIASTRRKAEQAAAEAALKAVIK